MPVMMMMMNQGHIQDSVLWGLVQNLSSFSKRQTPSRAHSTSQSDKGVWESIVSSPVGSGADPQLKTFLCIRLCYFALKFCFFKIPHPYNRSCKKAHSKF